MRLCCSGPAAAVAQGGSRSQPASFLSSCLPAPDCLAHQTPRSTGCGSWSMLSCTRWLLRLAGADLGPASLAVELNAGSVSASYFCEEKVCATRHAAGSHRLTTPQCYSYIDPDSHARFLSPFRLVIPALVFLSRSVRPGSHAGGGATPTTAGLPFAHLPSCLHHFKHCVFPISHHHRYYHYTLLLCSLLRLIPAFSARVSRVSLLSLSLLNYGQQSAIL